MKYSLTLIFSFFCTSAFADNCIQRFSGTWMARLNTGQTYTGQHLPNGVGTANCPGCSPGTWTCKGNQIFKSVNGMNYTGVLSPDGNTITEPYGVLTRVGGGAARLPASRDSEKGEDYMKQARAAGQYCTYADQTQAAGQYLKAADEFEAVGNTSRAAQAKKLAAAANAKSYQCDKQKQASDSPSRSRPAPNKAEELALAKKCRKAQQQYTKLRNAGADVTALKAALRAEGCL